MKFSIKWYGGGKYSELWVETSEDTMDSGLLDAKESKQLADAMREAAEELDPQGADDE